MIVPDNVHQDQASSFISQTMLPILKTGKFLGRFSDVTLADNCMLFPGKMEKFMVDLEVLGLLVASLCHVS
jgi:hypothetical protein